MPHRATEAIPLSARLTLLLARQGVDDLPVAL